MGVIRGFDRNLTGPTGEPTRAGFLFGIVTAVATGFGTPSEVLETEYAEASPEVDFPCTSMIGFMGPTSWLYEEQLIPEIYSPTVFGEVLRNTVMADVLANGSGSQAEILAERLALIPALYSDNPAKHVYTFNKSDYPEDTYIGQNPSVPEHAVAFAYGDMVEDTMDIGVLVESFTNDTGNHVISVTHSKLRKNPPDQGDTPYDGECVDPGNMLPQVLTDNQDHKLTSWTTFYEFDDTGDLVIVISAIPNATIRNLPKEYKSGSLAGQDLVLNIDQYIDDTLEDLHNWGGEQYDPAFGTGPVMDHQFTHGGGDIRNHAVITYEIQRRDADRSYTVQTYPMRKTSPTGNEQEFWSISGYQAIHLEPMFAESSNYANVIN